ncbi:MAG: HAD hydrolase family protein [bacterium]|nr:HAD hydrolase family protein [bacterium]
MASLTKETSSDSPELTRKRQSRAGQVTKNIKLVILDVDGVLTDGTLIVGDSGEEFKTFHVRDGLGITLAVSSGIIVAFLSGRYSQAITNRAKDLRVEEVHQGVPNKLAVYESLLKKYSLEDGEVCYIGDDLSDIPQLKRAGLSYAVADAAEEVKQAAGHVTQNPGGKGAVREVIDSILKAAGLWENAARRVASERSER